MPSIKQDPSAAAVKSHSSDSKRATRLPRLDQLALLQDFLLTKAHDPKLSLTALAQGSRAWKELESLRQEMLGNGKPKPVPASNDKGHAPRRSARTPAVPIGPSLSVVPVPTSTHTEPGTSA